MTNTEARRGRQQVRKELDAIGQDGPVTIDTRLREAVRACLAAGLTRDELHQIVADALAETPRNDAAGIPQQRLEELVDAATGKPVGGREHGRNHIHNRKGLA